MARFEIAWLKKRINKATVNAASDQMIGTKSSKIVLKLYNSELKKKASFSVLQKSLRKELRAYTSYNRLTSWFTRTKRELHWLIGGIERKLGWNSLSAYRRVSPSGGLAVAIIGCDGAGKTTTLSYITREFRKKLDVVSIYFGSGGGSSSLLRKPMKFVAGKVGGKGIGRAVEREYSESKKVCVRSRLYSMAKILWAVALAKEKKTKQRQMVKARNNGILVITDRYPQSLYPGASDGPLLNRYRNTYGILKFIAEWEQKIYKSFSENAPDLVIKLIVPTETAISRKPEMTVEEIENKKNIVMKLNISEHTAVIDASRPFIITFGEVMNEIWNFL